MGDDKGKGVLEDRAMAASTSDDDNILVNCFFFALVSWYKLSYVTSNILELRPYLTSRYPLRMRERCGCAMFGCSVSVPNTAESYCCDSHKTMATQMDSISGSPCIVFDGLKTVDVTLSTALLHRTRGRLAVGVPTLPATVFFCSTMESRPRVPPTTSQ
ncbi:unnamed protein product [Arabidopsis thaliana]|uniref:Uncharacterized protein n=1 Tax=Arabidopsis thaliana TaxID=3702 RepID=A0A654FT48_ARATH|nr:unnamed protein product [Arabidopsis thaliana]